MADADILLTGALIRAARALAGVSVEALAQKSSLGIATIRRAESRSTVSLTRANKERLIAALGDLGVEFIAADQGGPGVRLRSD